MAKKVAKKVKEERLEDILFNCRDHLRGRAPMTDKRDLLLTLVFLKFIAERFNERKEQILEEKKDDPKFAEIAVSRPSFYKQSGVFFIQDEYYWDKIIEKTESKNLAIVLDNAIEKLEQNEPNLKNALPKQIFTKTAFLTNYVNCPITSGTTFRLVSVDLYIKKYRSLSCGKYK